VQTSNVERVKELLEAGVNPDMTFDNGLSPLHMAHDPRVFELLIRAGAQLDIPDAPEIESPLENAAEYWFRDTRKRDQWMAIVTQLRAGGAEYTLEAAIYLNDIDFFRAALEKDDSWVNKPLGAKMSPLRFAVMTGRFDISKLLLDHKSDVDNFDEGNGFPIVVNAVKYPQIVKLLIERGTNLKRRISWRNSRSGYWIN
jgi:ankyrin repeat protein